MPAFMPHPSPSSSAAPSGWRTGLWRLIEADSALLRRQRRFAIAVFGALFIPALYALIYLSSLWDPSARTGALRAGLFNGDAGAVYRAAPINMGEEVVQTLMRQGAFRWERRDDEADARQAVRRGELSFAVLIPRDFSAQALGGREAGAAQLLIYTSEGNSYSAAGFARRFAPELAHRVNESLNEQRWKLVLESAEGSKISLETLREHVGELREGTRQARSGSTELQQGLTRAAEAALTLRRGSAQLADGSSQLASGWRPLAGGLRQLDAHRPATADLDGLRLGAQRLVLGQQDLGRGLDQLHDGSERLRDGAQALQQAATPIPLLGDSLAEAAQALELGAVQLHGGLGQARDASQRLTTGAQQLQSGVHALATGAAQHAGALHQLVTALPDDSRIDALASGAQQLGSGALALGDGLRRLQAGSTQLGQGLGQLETGSARLHAGLARLADALPRDLQVPEGSARGLADSVEPRLEVVAPVGSDGAGFAPNFVPMALWLGAVMAALLFNLRRLPDHAAALPRPVQVAGKLAWPVAVVLGQSAVMLTGLLGLRVTEPVAFLLTLGAASLTFLAILFLLIRWFGDVGKVLGIILLIVQLSSAGAALPIELATPFFQALHPYLPFTWVVRAFRASLFGAYDGQWAAHWAVVAGCGSVALLGATLAGRWKVVAPEDYHPGIEID
jgi:putative membrane protein